MRRECQAWLGLDVETDSILIKEKHKHLSKTSDRVSRKCSQSVSTLGLSREGFIEVYIHNRRVFIIVFKFHSFLKVKNETLQSWHLHSLKIFYQLLHTSQKAWVERPVALIKEGGGARALKGICRVTKWEQRVFPRIANIYDRSK